MEKIGDILKNIIKKRKWADKFSIEYLKLNWSKCVGENISNHTKPLFIKNKRLYISVDSPIWSTQLNFLKNEIIEKLNNFLGENIVEEIFFVLGSNYEKK
jgi:predicted nucleic acid-binding Zn ribbon protein